ncbi:unnamed protein product [Protopolystoma xenopodis]|uniref:Uncharacterized protein n=1 Tax=Protopolystoma xenopodis TaxID=117903 RepID=A0A448WWE1_9PLAT|nr:unnamed protein product [Protopolystoma xenopodis]
MTKLLIVLSDAKKTPAIVRYLKKHFLRLKRFGKIENVAWKQLFKPPVVAM